MTIGIQGQQTLPFREQSSYSFMLCSESGQILLKGDDLNSMTREESVPYPLPSKILIGGDKNVLGLGAPLGDYLIGGPALAMLGPWVLRESTENAGDWVSQ